MFVRDCWYVAAWDYELPADQPIGRTIINEPIVLYRAPDQSIVALEDRCCHRAAPLSLGRCEGSDIRCMYHGLKFDRTGRCVEIPGQDRIPPQAIVRAYPVEARHSWLWVWMGDPAKADPALIPPAIGLDDPDWVFRSGQMDYAAHYGLINDNLTDFTHLSYVHAKSFGTPEAFAATRPLVETLERGIRVSRWQRTMRSPNRPDLSGKSQDGDIWTAYDFLAPGILLMPSVHLRYPAGTADRLGDAKPDLSEGTPIHETFTSQAVTPLTDTTSRYFFSWGPRAGDGADATADQLLGLANMAFTEDRLMIEAQQRNLNLTGSRKEVLTSADVGPTRMRAVIERLIRADTGTAQQAA